MTYTTGHQADPEWMYSTNIRHLAKTFIHFLGCVIQKMNFGSYFNHATNLYQMYRKLPGKNVFFQNYVQILIMAFEDIQFFLF